MRILPRFILLSASTVALASAVQAQPQAAPEPTSPVSENPDAGSDIIVTATRRPERLSRVPVAVSVVDGNRLREENRNTVRDLAAIVPSLNFRSTASNKDQALFVRGLGTVSTSPGVEPTVSTVVDGVVLARQGQASFDLYDVDRIEVLRGPQGTLFGKNASAGVVNIVTVSPTDTLHGYADGFYGTRGDEWRLKAGISGAIVPDKLRASINGLYAHYNGNVRNVADGKRVNGYERKGVRGKLVWLPTDTLTITLGADYLRSADSAPQGVVTKTTLRAFPTGVVTNFPAFASAIAPVIPNARNRSINSNYSTFAKDKNGGVSLQADWDVAAHTITSITAWRSWQNLQQQDQDRLPAATAAFAQQHDVGHLDFEQFSQELRVASPRGRLIDYQFGLYFMHEDDNETYRRDTTTLAGGVSRTFTGIADYGITKDNYSAFGEATINATQQLRLIAGIRAIKDDLSYRFARTSTSPVPVTGIQTAFVSSGSSSPTGYSDRLGVQYDLAKTAMAYATYSHGYKGPAYNVAFSMLPQDTSALKPEENESYEFGLKARTADGSVAVNLAGFITEFSNYQVNFFDTYNGSPVTRLINAGAVSTRGIEADVSLRPIRSVRIDASGAYIKARINEFNCPAGTAVSCQVNGKTLPFSPDWKFNVRGTYTAVVATDLNVDFSTDYSWQDDTQFSINQTPDTIQPAYGIWNAGIAVRMTNGLRVSFIVKNLFDKSYATNLATFGQGVVRFVPRDDRRYFGIGIRKDL
ncbi:TonB-dependent receptor [Sphingomonadaceae bacterium OTU29THOMA1]|nr:TonB-dependent receptor [Sphingomonadaceae bacterium OTU29THOMA1]